MASKEFHLTIVRHGETEFNREGRMQGQINTDLNQTGKDQAAKAGKRLKNETYDKAYSSDLNRAYQTCCTILSHNATSAKDLEVEKLTSLRERGFGPWEGKLVSEYQAEAKKAATPGFDFHAEGAETVADEEARVADFFKKLLKDVNESGYKEVLVLTHGGLIYKMNHHLYKLGVIEGLPKPDAAKACPPNTGVSKFQMKISPEGQVTSGKCQIFMSGDHLDQ